MFICNRVASLVFAVLCFCEVIKSQQQNLNCQFESDICDFSNAATNNLNWIRKSDSSGSFLSLSSTHQSFEQTGRISSPSMAQFSGVKCLEFFYTTNDTTAKLNVYIKKTTETTNGNIIWRSNSSTGNQLSHILVDVTNLNQSYEIIFEGKIQASSYVQIKVDNIALLNDVCLKDFLCDFEQFFCMNQSDDDDGNWQRKSGRTASRSTGPSQDHTLGTSAGYYAYIEASNGGYWNVQYTVRMETQTIRSSSQVQDRCLVFWYHMYGRDIVSLNVYVLPNGETTKLKIFTKSGHGVNLWKTGHVTITERLNFKIILEATSNGYRGDIAVDDINVSLQKCVIGFQCDFDHGTCVEQDTTSDDIDWTIGKFWDQNENYQRLRDHTSGSGKYAYLKANDLLPKETAVFTTGILTSDPDDKLCLKFWYCVKGTDSGEILVFLVNSEGQLVRLIWNEHTTTGFNVWREAEIYFTPYDNYKVLFKAVGGDDDNGFLAIDDIEINNGPCSIQGEFNCTFEDGFRLDKAGDADTYQWNLHNRFVTSMGPFYDHTLGDDQGHYAFVDAHQRNNANDTAIMLTPLVHSSGEDETKCLTFWYHMYGIHIQSLEVFALSMLESVPGTLKWSRLGNRGNIWRAAEVEIKGITNFQVVFRSVRGDGNDGDIGVDDITIKNQSCINTDNDELENGVNCQFEEPHICGYTNAADNAFNWTWTNSALGSKHDVAGVPEFDHTKSNALGFYVLADFRQSKLIREIARFQSPVKDDTSLQCLELWHFIHGTDTQEFRVLKSQTRTTELLFSIKGNRGPFWQKTTKELSPTDKYSIIFEVSSGVMPVGGVAIDDVVIRSGNCEIVPNSPTPEPKTVFEADCDFESKDLCGYIQDVNDDFDWTWKSAAEIEAFYKTLWWFWYWYYWAGHHWYPHTDKSLPFTNTGKFLFTEVVFYAPREEKDDVARILSPLIKKTESKTCLKFWFYKQSVYSEFLNVYVLKHNDLLHGDPLVALFGSYGNQWVQQQVDLPPSSKPFQIVFESLKGQWWDSTSFIDEIDYERSPCPSGDMVCDFENGFEACQISYEERAATTFHWQLSRGFTATNGTGPTADHTFGNDTGMYVYIDASQPQSPGDQASLSTRFWEKIERDTCLKFWYYCDSKKSGNFFVYHRTRDSKELLWQMPRYFQRGWSEVRIQLPPANKSYQIVFTGVVGNSVLGDIALDDIVLSSLPCTVSSNTPPIDGTASKLKVLQNYDCSLKQGNCKIDQLVSDQFDWTFSETNRSYLFSSSENRYIGQKAQFKTPSFSGKKKQCLQITYKTTGTFIPTLSVFKVESTNKMNRLWSSNKRTDEWKTEWIPTQSPSSSYNMIFDATVAKAGNGTVHIQAIKLSPGKCPNSSNQAVVAITVVMILLLIALIIFVTIALLVYRKRKLLSSEPNVRHTTLNEDVTIDTVHVHNDKLPIVDEN